MDKIKEQELLIMVDGKKVSLHEFNEISNNPKLKLKEISTNNYKTLSRLYG